MDIPARCRRRGWRAVRKRSDKCGLPLDRFMCMRGRKKRVDGLVDRIPSPKTAGVTSTFVVDSTTRSPRIHDERLEDLVATNEDVLRDRDRRSIFKGPLEVAAAHAMSYLSNLDERPVGA